MKKVVGGMRYDTDKATEVASWSYGYPSDFQYSSETLYRTTSGRYFLHGEGGANTRWRECVGQNSWCNGEDIEAMVPEQGLAWLESHGRDVPEGCPELSALVIDA